MIVWGLSVPAMKIALRDFPALGLSFLRYLAAAPLFVAWLIGRPLPVRRDLWRMAWLGLIGIVVGQMAQIVGVQFTTASAAIMLTATIPMFTLLLAVPILGQRVAPRHLAGIAAATAGVALIAWDRPAGTPADAGLLGTAILLVASIAIAAYYAVGTSLTRRCGAMTTASWSCLAGLIGMAPIGTWDLLRAPPAVTWPGVAMVLFLGWLVSAAGLFVFLWTMQRVPARIAAGSQFLQPPIGVAASAWLFGDAIGGWFAIGAVLVLAGIALTAIPARPSATPPSGTPPSTS